MKRALASLLVVSDERSSVQPACLASLRANTPVPYELIFVEADPVRGVSWALNQGIRRSKGRYIAFLNEALVLTPGWLDQLIRCLKSDQEIQACGPIIQIVSSGQGDLEPSRHRLDRFSRHWSVEHKGQVQGTHRLSGHCVAFKRSVFDSIGLLDERISGGGLEKLDYTLRIIQAGYKLAISSDTLVYCKQPINPATESKSTASFFRSKKNFTNKWCAQPLGFLDDVEGAMIDAAPVRRNA